MLIHYNRLKMAADNTMMRRSTMT